MEIIKSIEQLSLSNETTGITALPAELLLIIFRFLYLSTTLPCAKPGCHACAHLSPLEHRYWPEGMLEGTPDAFFPYSPAAVSRRWRALLAAEPEFWTRLIIFLDSNPNKIKSQLKRSSPYPVHIIVVGLKQHKSKSTEYERSRLDMMLKIIRPETDRVHHLWIAHVHGDSVSSTICEIGKSSRMLESIIIEPIASTLSEGSRIIYESESEESQANEIGIIHCPNLSFASLDGRNFNNLNRYVGGAENAFPSLKRLIIAGGDFSEKSAIDPIATIHRMKTVLYLHLKSVKLPLIDDLGALRPNFHLSAVFVKLEKLGADTVQTFLRRTTLPQLSTLVVSQCDVDSTQDFPDCWTVYFERIPLHPGTSQFGNLQIWRGTELKFTRCDGFNDDFLGMFGTVVDGAFPCGNVRTIVVEHCANFSVGAMKDMIMGRSIRQDSNIFNLRVTGGFAISEEDRDWFRTHVRRFEWVSS